MGRRSRVWCGLEHTTDHDRSDGRASASRFIVGRVEVRAIAQCTMQPLALNERRRSLRDDIRPVYDRLLARCCGWQTQRERWVTRFENVFYACSACRSNGVHRIRSFVCIFAGLTGSRFI